MDRESALKQIDDALAVANTIREDHSPGAVLGTFVCSALYSTIERLAPPNSPYEKSITTIRELDARSYPGYVAPRLAGILRALRRDIENGYIESLSGLIRAEEFSDFLSMAQHLIEEGYKDPAAVIAGTVLEQHLRALAAKNNIETATPDGRWKKADTLNSEMVKEGVYGKTMQKNVTSWLGLRNEAAHGEFSKYEHANVRLMIDGISLFLLQNPS